ncbi:MAG: thiolase family protein [Bacillaceae bacterium]
MREVVIVEGVRTPIGKYKGSLKNIRPENLAAIVLKELIVRSKVSSALVDDVILGCVTQSKEQAGDIARISTLLADFPITVPGVTIDRQCGSSLQAISFASQAIMSGDMDIVIAGGVESMTRVPMFSNLQDAKWNEELVRRYGPINQGLSAELINEKWNFTREQLDAFSLNSHKKALAAQQEGRFINEILPIPYLTEDGEQCTLSNDEGPRSNTTIEKLASLKPVFKEDGKIHAGNASQISDGASAVLLMSMEKAKELQLKPKFKIVARSIIGSDPTLMLTGPIPATFKVLEKAGLSLEEIDLFEINEAFASVPLCWLQETGVPEEKLNVNGGAIALGHPLGATGTRITVTLMNEMERRKARYGLIAICEGHGMANATIIERIEE